jgi:hypothetical protein
MPRKFVRIVTAPRYWLIGFALFSSLHAMLAAASQPVGDPDVWWVAAAGRNMLATGRVPTRNLFSFMDAQQPWIMHEWLLGPIYALGLMHFGAGFFVLIPILVLSCGLWLLLAGTLRSTRNPLAGSLLACLSVTFFLRRLITPRPSCVALLYPLAMLRLAFASRFNLPRRIGCVLLQWLWTNSHGSFPLGIALLLAAAVEYPAERALRFSAAGAAFVVSFANPYGLRLHGFVWDYLSGRSGIYREINRHIDEFASLPRAWGNLINPLEVIGFAMLVLMSLAALRKPAFRLRGALCLALFALAYRQVRHFELAGLVSCMLLAPWADAWVTTWADPDQGDARFARRCQLLLTLPTYLLGATLFAANCAQRTPEQWIAPDYAFVDQLRAVPNDAHLYVPFHFAGYAIWLGYPRGIRVFFDPRNDCYSIRTFEMFKTLSLTKVDPARVRAVLDESATDVVLVPRKHPLDLALTNAAGWQRLPNSEFGFRRTSTATHAAVTSMPASLQP